MLVGALAAAVVGLAITGLLLAIGGGTSEPERSGSAAATKNIRAAKPAASPEALEAREGIDVLDSPTPRPPKNSMEAPRKPIATDLDRAKTAASRIPAKAAPPQKAREPKPGTPEADFGLPMVDQ